MSWQVQHPRVCFVGFAIIATGGWASYFGTMAFMFIGLPLLAVGWGTVAASHTTIGG